MTNKIIYDSLDTVRELVQEGSLDIKEGDIIHTWFATDYFGNKVRDNHMADFQYYEYSICKDNSKVDGGSLIKFEEPFKARGLFNEME